MLKVIALFLLPICVLGVKFNGTMKTALGACSLCDPASYCLQPLQAGFLTVHFWPSATMVPTGTPSLHTFVASVFALYPDCNWIPPSLFASGRSLGAGIIMSDACFMGPQGRARQAPLPYTAQHNCGSFSPIPIMVPPWYGDWRPWRSSTHSALGQWTMEEICWLSWHFPFTLGLQIM